MSEPYPCDGERWPYDEFGPDGERCVLEEGHDGQHIYERIGDEP